jgi:hypothetical protein
MQLPSDKDITLIREQDEPIAPISHSPYTLVAKNAWGNERTQSRTM